MEEYKIETRIRQIVLELSQPSLNRVTNCLSKLESTDQKIDELCKKLEIYEQSASHYQQNNQQKFTDLENLMQLTKRLETDAARQHNSINQQIIQLRGATDQLKLDNQNQTTHQQYMTNAHLKQQSELEICQKKQTESHEIFNKKIEEFFKDYYTFFVDCRNQVSQINKEYVLLNRELKAQGTHLDEFHKHAENQFSFNQGFSNRLDLVSNEINECVHKDMFQLQFGKEEEKRILQMNQIRNQVEQSLFEFKTTQISILERISGLENYEIIYRNQLNLYEQELNKHIEESQCVQRSTTQELYNLQVQINKLQTNYQELEKVFKESSEQTMNALQSKLKREVFSLNQNLEQFKQESQNQILRELKMSQEQVKQEIMNEQKNKLDDQSELLKEQLKSQIISEIQLIKEQSKTLQQDVEVQVNIQPKQQQQQLQQDVIQQKQDSQGLIEFPSIQNNESTPDAIQLEECIRQNNSLQQYLISLVNPQGVVGGNAIQGNRIRLKSINSLPKVSEHDKITVLWDRITDQLDDIRTDIQILNEMREESDQRFKLFETEFNLGMNKLERNHSILLKLKSDVHNDLEYLNSQISVLFREKENNCRSNKKIIQLISGNSEINYIILSNLLSSFRDMNCKYQLNNEVILEIKQDQKALYRGTQFEMEDLLKKGFLSLIQLWEKNELIDTKEMNPNIFFEMNIHKSSTVKGKNVNTRHQTKNSTIDRTMEKDKSIKCPTTQTIIEDKLAQSDRPKASYRSVNCRGEKKKNLTVQQILKQQFRSTSVHNSNEQLPKVILKKQ